jgi:hypothetical protein
MFMANGFAAQLEFVYQSNFEEMYLVTDELNPRYGGTSVLTGEARRTTTGCPAGLGDPLNILNSTTWSFRTFPAYYANSSGASSVGTLNAFNLGTGRLTGTETINYGSFGPIVRGAQIGGRYIINSDCSGGELIITNRGNPAPSLQLEFVFAGPNYKQIYMLNDSLTSLPAINFTTKVDKKADSTQEFEIYPYPMYGDSYTVIAGVAKQQ